jgi:signal transduction histidine kinase/CheY-like chemotaxis protein
MNRPEPSNILEAESAKNWDRYTEEMDRLDRAIAIAQEQQSLEAEALANERAALFYWEWGKQKIAAAYMQDAYDCYMVSGCTEKTAEIEQSYPQLLSGIYLSPQPAAENNYFTDEFIATLSHEFRTSLSGLLGMSEALLEEVFGSLNEQQLNAVTTIERSGGYLLALINNMTDLSKVQIGKLELEIGDVPVVSLCESSIAFVKHHAIQKNIQLDLDLPANVGNIVVDPQRMSQVLIDLLDRAIDSTPVGGSVELVVNRYDPQDRLNSSPTIEFSIVDTSKDISTLADDLSSRSLHPIDNRRIGLGLMLVNPIVELHGGFVSFQSNIGRGSCVKISIPDRHAMAYSTLDPHDRSDELESISGNIAEDKPKLPLILIAEDNELNINTISSYLTAKGYRPIIATDGYTAIELAQKYLPDLIVMDVQMPGMDGLAAIASIRQQPQLANIPIIALTALAMEGDREKCLAAGANEYMTKPVKLKELNHLIQQFLQLK